MLDRSNLNRIKGILSARQGAEIPKFLGGAKFAKEKNGKIIYSADGSTWFSDLNLTFPHMGSLEGFLDVSTPDVPQEFEIPGDTKITPNTAVETSAQVNKQIQQQQTTQAAEQAFQQPKLESINPGPISINQPPLKLDELKMKEEISAGVNLIQAKYKQEQQAKQDRIMRMGQAGVDAFNTIGQTFGAKQSMSDSSLTKTVDSAYQGISNIASNFGPIGKAVGSIMQTASAAGNIIQEMGGGTDQQTKMDKWMDSSFFSWNVGMLNGFAGKKSDSFGIDNDILEKVGSSYGGTTTDLIEASDSAGKKYGLFSSKARKKANAAIASAKTKQATMGDIADVAGDQRLAAQSMGEQAGLAYSLMTDGGYNQKYTYAAKQGGIIDWNPVPNIEWELPVVINWELPTFKEGGNIDIVEELEWIPELQSGNKINLDEVRKYFKDYDLSNVEFIMDKSPRTEGNKLYISNDEDAVHELWHYLSNNQPNEVYKDYYDRLNDNRIIELGGDLQFVKRFENDPGHFYHPSELEARIKAAKFKTQGQPYTKEFFQNLRNDENKYGNNMRDLLHMYNDDNLVKIFSLKKGGSLGDSDIPEIEETNQKNVIPEGALHKNKHHMEHAEGLTKKGIPVIDDEGEQQAEIEHSEIIFTLEVTKKLEEYYETFYSDESSNKEKEQAALEAGYLLVYQILENTEDRTGLIETCKNGGTLTSKSSTKSSSQESEKDKMKEALKEALIELLVK